MNLVLAGLNHRTAPVALREKIAFRPEDLPKAFQLFRKIPEIRESLILSTCNRTEIYAVAYSAEANTRIPECVGEFHEIAPNDFLKHLYTKQGIDVVRHLFYVASGLDSLVLGEDQILSQVKQFFRLAQESKSLGIILHRLFQSAIETGKKIRHQTAIGENPGSIGAAAVDLAEQIFGQLKGKHVLVVGTGEMGRLVAATLIESGVANPMIVTRTFSKANELAHEMNGTAYPIEELEKPLLMADIVITASGSSTPIFTKTFLEPILKERRYAPLFVIDIAVPRDVEEAAAELSNLFLYNIDDLQQIVEHANLALKRELAKAHQILEGDLAKFITWHESLQVSPTIKTLMQRMDDMRSKEIQRILVKYPNLEERDKSALENLAHSLVNKILHRPLIQMKTYANHPLGIDYIEIVRNLFGLETPDD